MKRVDSVRGRALKANSEPAGVVREFGSSRDRDRGIEFRISQGNTKVEEGEKYVL